MEFNSGFKGLKMMAGNKMESSFALRGFANSRFRPNNINTSLEVFTWYEHHNWSQIRRGLEAYCMMFRDLKKIFPSQCSFK